MIEIFKIQKILRDLKQEREQSAGLSKGYVRTEGKYIADQIIHFKSTYLQSICAPQIKEVELTTYFNMQCSVSTMRTRIRHIHEECC